MDIDLDQKMNWLLSLSNDKYFKFNKKLQDDNSKQILANIIYFYCGDDFLEKYLDKFQLKGLKLQKSDAIIKPDYIHFLKWIEDYDYIVYIKLLEAKNEVHCVMYNDSLKIRRALLGDIKILSELYYEYIGDELIKINDNDYICWDDEFRLWKFLDENNIISSIKYFITKNIGIDAKNEIISEILKIIMQRIYDPNINNLLNKKTGFLPIKNGRILNFKTKQIKKRIKEDYFSVECNVEIETDPRIIEKVSEFMSKFNTDIHKLMYYCLSGEETRSKKYYIKYKEYKLFENIIEKILDKFYLISSLDEAYRYGMELSYARLIIHTSNDIESANFNPFTKHIFIDENGEDKISKLDLAFFKKMQNEYLDGVFTWILHNSVKTILKNDSISDFLEICRYNKDIEFVNRKEIWIKYKKFCEIKKIEATKLSTMLYDRIENEKMPNGKDNKFQSVQNEGKNGFKNFLIKP
jgi:hypothetical protein